MFDGRSRTGASPSVETVTTWKSSARMTSVVAIARHTVDAERRLRCARATSRAPRRPREQRGCECERNDSGEPQQRIRRRVRACHETGDDCGSHDPSRVSKTIATPSTTAPTGFVTCAAERHERAQRERARRSRARSRRRSRLPSCPPRAPSPSRAATRRRLRAVARCLPELCVPGQRTRREHPPERRPLAVVRDVHGAAATQALRERERCPTRRCPSRCRRRSADRAPPPSRRMRPRRAPGSQREPSRVCPSSAHEPKKTKAGATGSAKRGSAKRPSAFSAITANAASGDRDAACAVPRGRRSASAISPSAIQRISRGYQRDAWFSRSASSALPARSGSAAKRPSSSRLIVVEPSLR